LRCGSAFPYAVEVIRPAFEFRLPGTPIHRPAAIPSCPTKQAVPATARRRRQKARRWAAEQRHYRLVKGDVW
jgi:hypothetical protein